MSLSFSTEKGSFEQRWIVYAYLRDCVQHHLEHGVPSPAFDAIHRVSEAVGGQSVRLSAQQLRNELEVAKKALSTRPIADLAISTRTQAALSFSWPPPEHHSTTLVLGESSTVPLLGSKAETLDDVFGAFLDALLEITQEPAQTVEVRDL